MTKFHFTASVLEGIETVLKLVQGTLSVVPVDPDGKERGWDELQAARITPEKLEWEGFTFFTDIAASSVEKSPDYSQELKRSVTFYVGQCMVAHVELVGLANPYETNPSLRSETAMWCAKQIQYFQRYRNCIWGDWRTLNCEPQF